MLEKIQIGFKKGEGALEHAIHNVAHLRVHPLSSGVAVAAVKPGRLVAGAEKAGPIGVVADMPEVFVHPVPRDHGAGDVGRLDQIVRRPGRDMIVDDLLCCAPAKQDCDLGFEFLPRHQEAVLGRRWMV